MNLNADFRTSAAIFDGVKPMSSKMPTRMFA